MAELKALKCPFCGDTFKQGSYKQIYCNTKCRNGMRSKRDAAKRGIRPKRNGISDLRRITIEARMAGMTYGQYVAQKGL